MVDSQMLQLARQLSADEAKLLELRKTRAEFEAAADKDRGATQTLEYVYRFIGSTEQALKILVDLEGEGGLNDRMKSLNREINKINKELDENKRKEPELSTKKKISDYIIKFVQQIGVKGADGTPRLDDRELNLKFTHENDAKPDFLWEIGSGENWMAYHLATLLALHGIFLSRKKNNNVPTFLIIDQPSQVYFPSDTFEDLVNGKINLEEQSKSRRGRRHLDDLESTRQIFRTLARAHKAFKGQLQIIVLDHADKRAWGEQELHESGNWRNEADFLIPVEWGE